MTGTYNEIRCPKCKASIFVYAEQAGEQMNCPRCQNQILIPGEKASPEANKPDDLLIDLDSSDDVFESTNPIEIDSGSKTLDPQPGDSGMDEIRLADESSDSLVIEDDQNAIAFDSTMVAKNDQADDEDDLGELLPAPDLKPIEKAPDAFEFDDNRPLEIEGVTPADGQFSIECHLCGSLLYGRVSQVGTKIKCHDCHSMVEVPKPRVEPTPVEPETQSGEESEDAGYRLSDPVKLEPLDTTFDITLGEIDYEDEDFFEKRRQLENAGSDSESPDIELAPASEIDQPLKVEPIEKPTSQKPERFKGHPASTHDPVPGSGKPEGATAGYELAPTGDRPKPQSQSWGSQTNSVSDPIKEEKDAKIPQSDEPETKKATPRSEEPLDYPSPVSDLADWLVKASYPLRDSGGLLRIGLATALIGICYVLILTGCGYFTEDSKAIQKFVGFIIISIGSVPLALVLFTVGVYANSVIRVAMEGRGTLAEWPDFSIADWISQFVFVGTSFWISAFPGVVLGTLLSIIGQNPVWLFMSMILSSLFLSPIILSSVVFNESPSAVFTPAVLKSFSPMKNRWVRFMGFAFAIGIMLALSVAILSLLVAGPITVAFLVAAFQVALLFCYWWTLGDHVGHVVRWLAKQSG